MSYQRAHKELGKAPELVCAYTVQAELSSLHTPSADPSRAPGREHRGDPTARAQIFLGTCTSRFRLLMKVQRSFDGCVTPGSHRRAVELGLLSMNEPPFPRETSQWLQDYEAVKIHASVSGACVQQLFLGDRGGGPASWGFLHPTVCTFSLFV